MKMLPHRSSHCFNLPFQLRCIKGEKHSSEMWIWAACFLTPGSSLGSSSAGFTSPDLAAMRSILRRQRPLLPHKGALFHQTFYTPPPLQRWLLSSSRENAFSQRKGKMGPTIGQESSHIDIHSDLIITVVPRGRQQHSTLTNMKTEVQRSELFNWDINSGLHSSIWMHSLSHPPGHLLRPWSEHFAHQKPSWD